MNGEAFFYEYMRPFFMGMPCLMNIWGFFIAEKHFSRNKPGSRISSNLRTPDHLGRIPGQKKIRKKIGPKSRFSSVFRGFWSPGILPEWSGSILGKSIFGDFRWFSSEFSGGRPIFREKSWFFMKSHDFSRKVLLLWRVIIHGWVAGGSRAGHGWVTRPGGSLDTPREKKKKEK